MQFSAGACRRRTQQRAYRRARGGNLDVMLYRRCRSFALVLIAVGGGPACRPITDATDAIAPEPRGDLIVTADASASQVAAGASVVLSATAIGGTAPYTFRWDMNAGPEGFSMPGEVASSTLAVDSLAPAGRYVFRVTVTDSRGLHDTDFVVVVADPHLTVEARADGDRVMEGSPVTLTAVVTGATAEVVFEWSVESSPIALDVAGETSAELTTEPLTSVGTYVFVVKATDATGLEATDNIAVEVVGAGRLSVPARLTVCEPARLSAGLGGSEGDVTILWEVISGEASLADTSANETTLTATAPGAVHLRLTVDSSPESEQAETTTQDFAIESVETQAPRVLIQTNLGPFTVELDGAAAPLHTANFLAYVDEGFYDGLLFHRNACMPEAEGGECLPFVLQGGGFRRVDGELDAAVPTHEPVETEAGNGLTNAEVYSVAVALTDTDVNSGTSQFFINLADNSFLDDRGFTVFGRVVAGTAVVDGIVAMERTESPIVPGEVSLPVEDVMIDSAVRTCD
ncbi:MAG: peptidylprolyl isomerase [Phycisphaerae bacterium]